MVLVLSIIILGSIIKLVFLSENKPGNWNPGFGSSSSGNAPKPGDKPKNDGDKPPAPKPPPKPTGEQPLPGLS